jgi:hypothetical protein
LKVLRFLNVLLSIFLKVYNSHMAQFTITLRSNVSDSCLNVFSSLNIIIMIITIMRWVGHVTRIWPIINSYRTFPKNPEMNVPFGRRNRKCKADIRLCLRVSIQMNQGRVHWWAFRVP